MENQEYMAANQNTPDSDSMTYDLGIVSGTKLHKFFACCLLKSVPQVRVAGYS